MNNIDVQKKYGKRIYQVAKRDFLEKHPECFLSHVLFGKIQPANEIHHTKGRVGELLNDARFWLQINTNAHRWLEDHLAAARELDVLFHKGYGLNHEEEFQRLQKWRNKVTFPLMAFSMTIDQLIMGMKDVTRRQSTKLKPGQIFIGVDKSMGFKAGQKPIRLAVLKCIRTHEETLEDIYRYPEDCAREGFPDFSPGQFIDMLCSHYGAKPEMPVVRIEFQKLANIPQNFERLK
jgi:hypothetical protein